MTNEELMQIMTDLGLHEGGMENWVVDNAWLRVANEVADRAIKPWAKQLEVERKKFKELNEVSVGAMKAVRLDEREACAKLCEAWQEWGSDGALLAKAIRARGQA